MSALTTAPERCDCDLMLPWLARRSLLLGMCLRWTRGNSADAEDLLSDACVKALEASRVGSAPVANAVGLWATIIANLGRDRRRRDARRQQEDAPTHASLPAIPASTVRPDDAASSREMLDVALVTLTTLPAVQQTALALRSVGADYGEIAGQLDVSAGNARKLVQLARGSMRGALGAGVSRHPGPRCTGRLPAAAANRSALAREIVLS